MKFSFARLRAIITINACFCIMVCAGQAGNQANLKKPAISAAEEVMQKLIAIAKDPASNGLSLMDTISPNNTVSVGPSTTLPFPGALSTHMLSRQVSYQGDVASISYVWRSMIAKVPKGDTIALHKELGRLQMLIYKVLPQSKDSFSTVTDRNSTVLVWNWKVATGITLLLKAKTNQQYNLPDEVELQFSVNKKLKQNQQKIVDSLYNRYALLANEAPGRKDASSYALSLMRFLQQEGLSSAIAIEKMKPLFKSIADRDITAGFDILLSAPDAAVPVFQAMLSDTQKASVRSLAQGVVDEYARKHSGVVTARKEEPVRQPLVKQRFIPYNTLYRNKSSGKYVYIVSLDDSLGIFTIRNAWLQPKRTKADQWHLGKSVTLEVKENYFFPADNWQAVDVHNCFSCQGSGWIVTRTPYTYYREEKGIYNKYTYSGSGVSVTSEQCKMCNAQGYVEDILR